jgi:hypothetical protein
LHTKVINMTVQQQNIIEKCTKAALACEFCMSESIAQNAESMKKCIRLCRDCADMCMVTVTFIARDSTFSKKLLKLCSLICALCAKECERHPEEHCQECAEQCKLCAEHCEELNI